jgi:hypothetical protein
MPRNLIALSRWLLVTGLVLLGAAALLFIIGLGTGLGGDTSGARPTLVLAELCFLLAVGANPVALVLALVGYRRSAATFPWLVVVVSGSGLLVTVVWLGFLWRASHG